MIYKQAQDILLHEIALPQAGMYPQKDADLRGFWWPHVNFKPLPRISVHSREIPPF